MRKMSQALLCFLISWFCIPKLICVCLCVRWQAERMRVCRTIKQRKKKNNNNINKILNKNLLMITRLKVTPPFVRTSFPFPYLIFIYCFYISSRFTATQSYVVGVHKHAKNKLKINYWEFGKLRGAKALKAWKRAAKEQRGWWKTTAENTWERIMNKILNY